MNEDQPPDTVRPSNRPPALPVQDDEDGETIPVPGLPPSPAEERLVHLIRVVVNDAVGELGRELRQEINELRQETGLCLCYVREISTELGIRARLHAVPAGEHTNSKPTNGAGT